eukprot:GHRR01014510.1.p3 GENE.GHRR01014510.1~~GHRR01014510.1.p3  ORF type:complete len:108 (+),score=19.67 GHRR01014510.1:2734-3057(+)
MSAFEGSCLCNYKTPRVYCQVICCCGQVAAELLTTFLVVLCITCCRRNRRPRKPRALRIYEAHVGMSGEDERVSTYVEFRDNVLPRIKAQGYTAIQLMAIQVKWDVC